MELPNLQSVHSSTISCSISPFSRISRHTLSSLLLQEMSSWSAPTTSSTLRYPFSTNRSTSSFLMQLASPGPLYTSVLYTCTVTMMD